MRILRLDVALGKQGRLEVFGLYPGPVIYSIVPVTFWSARCALPTTQCADVSLYRRAKGTAENVRDTVGVPESGRDIHVRRANSLPGSGV